MKKFDRKMILIIFFLVFLIAPIREGYRYFFLALVPMYLALTNAVILRDQIFLNIANEKFLTLEKSIGTKKAFIVYILMLILIPVLLAFLLIYSGIKLL